MLSKKQVPAIQEGKKGDGSLGFRGLRGEEAEILGGGILERA